MGKNVTGTFEKKIHPPAATMRIRYTTIDTSSLSFHVFLSTSRHFQPLHWGGNTDTHTHRQLYTHGNGKLNYGYDQYVTSKNHTNSMSSDNPTRDTPFPIMPSQLFFNMAQSLLELVANSMHYTNDSYQLPKQIPKINSMALYLPSEHPTGYLEFLPALVYPPPEMERVFIASDASAGTLPTIPNTLAKLVGFAKAQTLLPFYPFTSSNSASVGTIEEVQWDVSSSSMSTLSLPLLHGSETIGVLLIWPNSPPPHQVPSQPPHRTQWTTDDKHQLSRAAHTLLQALLLDYDRGTANSQMETCKIAMMDSLHQMKNPMQAMRTFAKLLQVQMAKDPTHPPQIDVVNEKIKYWAEQLVCQSERAVEFLLPMDHIVNLLDNTTLFASGLENIPRDPWSTLKFAKGSMIRSCLFVVNDSSSESYVMSKYICDDKDAQKGVCLVTGSSDGFVEIWDSESKYTDLRLDLDYQQKDELMCHSDVSVMALATSRDGNMLASGDSMGTIKVC